MTETMKRGLTYIEVLVAIAVLVAMLTSVLVMSRENVQGLQLNRRKLIAHLAAQELSEQLLSLTWEDLEPRVYEDGEIRDGAPISGKRPWGWRVTGVPGVKRRVTISDEPALLARKILVEVTLDAASGTVPFSLQNSAVLVRENP